MNKGKRHFQHKTALIIWIAIYPLITILYYLLGGLLLPLPIPLKTLILTVIAVPIMFYLLIPLLNKLFSMDSNQTNQS